MSADIKDADSKDIGAWFSKGNHLRETGRSRDAIVCYQKVIDIRPDVPEAYNNLGIIFSSRDEISKAISCFQRAVKVDPDFEEAYYNLGNIYKKVNDIPKAVLCYEQSLRLNPDYVSAYFNMGVLWLNNGCLGKAVESFEKVLKIKPDYPEALYNIGNALKKSGRNHEALRYYQKALDVNPGLAEAYNSIGNIYFEDQKWQDAFLHYEKAVNLFPGDAKICYNMGAVLLKQEKFDKGLACFKQALEINPDLSAARWSYLLSLPMIYKNENEIKYYRNRFKSGLDMLAAETRLNNEENKKNALNGLMHQENFFLTYQGLDDLELKKKFGQLACKITAANYPQWAFPRKMPDLGSNGKIRIGYLSSYMSSHTVGIFLSGWLSHSNRQEFELYCYHIGNKLDDLTGKIKQSCDFFYNIYNNTEKVAEQIINDNLHILVFTDIGMNPQATIIASLRLAPVQCKGWGHPVTTGMPAIDYYLSSDLMESENAQDYYSEKLIRLPNLALCCAKPKMPEEIKTREDFNIDDQAFVYLSSQSLFKYLPRHDFVFPAIASRIPNAQFVFLENQSLNATRLFKERLGRAFKEYGLDYKNYCIFQPRLCFDDFISLNLASDVLLDTIMWSGGKTTFEGLGCGLPVVTLPGPFLRSRHAYAMLKMMGITETIAENINNYIEIAVRLGRDQKYFDRLRMLIQKHNHKIYDDTSFMNSLEQFYKEQALKKTFGTIYQTNLELLEKRFPAVHKLLKQHQEAAPYASKVVSCGNGFYNIVYQLPDGGEIPFYPEEDIESQSNRVMSDWRLEQQDFLFCIGMGLGYIPLSCLKKYKQGHRIVIIEPEISAFNAAMQLVDLRPLLNYKKLDIFIGYDWNLLQIINNYGFDLLVGKQRVLTHAASRMIFGKKFLDFEGEVKASIGLVRDMLYTSKEMGRDIFSNTIMNLPTFFSSVTLGELRGRFRGFPAFCIAAGPSLDSAMDELKLIGNKGILIAIDSAVPALLQAGIVPHMIVTADARKENIEKYRACLDRLRNTVLVYGVESNPDNVRLFLGKRKLAVSINNPIINDWIGSLWNKDSNLPAMTTASHGALFTALALGVEAVVLVGMDMAFPTGVSHSKMAVHRYSFDNTDGLVKVEGTDGMPVYSYRPLNDYRLQIENVLSQTDIPFINTSLAGASVKGAVIKSFKEIIDTLLNNEADLNEVFDSISWESAIPDTEIILEASLLLQKIKTFESECLFFDKMALETVKFFSSRSSKEVMLAQRERLNSFCKEFDHNNSFIIKLLDGLRLGELKELTLRKYSIESREASQAFLETLTAEVMLLRDCFRSQYRAAEYCFDLINTFFSDFERAVALSSNGTGKLDDPSKMIEGARFFAGLNEIRKAEGLYKEYLKKNPDDIEAACELIDMFISSELWAPALKEAQAICPPHGAGNQAFKKMQEVKLAIESLLTDAGQALQAGDNNIARVKLMEYQSIFPDCAKALQLQTELHSTEKKQAASLVDARANALRAEELEEQAEAFLRLNEFEKAAGIIEGLLSRFLDRESYYREKIGDLRAVQQEYRSAIWNYKEALRMDKGNKNLLEKIHRIEVVQG